MSTGAQSAGSPMHRCFDGPMHCGRPSSRSRHDAALIIPETASGLPCPRNAARSVLTGLGLPHDAQGYSWRCRAYLRADKGAEKPGSQYRGLAAAYVHHRAVGQHDSAPTTWFVVKPYFRQWTPPEFSARLLPMEISARRVRCVVVAASATACENSDVDDAPVRRSPAGSGCRW